MGLTDSSIGNLSRCGSAASEFEVPQANRYINGGPPDATTPPITRGRALSPRRPRTRRRRLRQRSGTSNAHRHRSAAHRSSYRQATAARSPRSRRSEALKSRARSRTQSSSDARRRSGSADQVNVPQVQTPGSSDTRRRSSSAPQVSRRQARDGTSSGRPRSDSTQGNPRSGSAGQGKHCNAHENHSAAHEPGSRTRSQSDRRIQSSKARCGRRLTCPLPPHPNAARINSPTPTALERSFAHPADGSRRAYG